MRFWAVLFAVLLARAQQGSPPDASLLSRIRTKVADNLKRLPNYTCTQTIVRSLRRSRSARLQRVDTVKLDVAYLDGKELYGRPGSSIDESKITQLVSGTIGNGDFAGLPSSIFLGTATQFDYQGESKLSGKAAIRYNYTVPKFASGYQIQAGPVSALVGYHGSFWVDPESLDLMRLDVYADDIPETLKLTSAIDHMDYDHVSIGGSEFLLPRGAELNITDATGAERKNRMRLQACHQFVGESALSFTDLPIESFVAPSKPTLRTLSLPDDFVAQISLETPIDSASSMVGDSVEGTVKENIRAEGEAVIPKGTKISGHIARLEKRGVLYYLDLAFDSLELRPGRADLTKRENGVTSQTEEPLVFRLDHVKLARGARLLLHSRLVKSEDHDPVRH